MGFYEVQVVPRVIDRVLGVEQYKPIRTRVSAGLNGEVLEVGFGSGLNVPMYPPAVRRVRAVDPAVVGRKLAAARVAASPVPIEYVGLDGESLPVETASVDHVLVTWTLCTIPDAEGALREMRRVLRPGGELHFVEHGRSPDHKVAQWQDRMTPIQRKLAAGCHLNRRIDDLVTGAGFTMTKLDNYYVKGPKAFGYLYEGLATSP